MQHEESLAFQFDDDALAHARDADDASTLGIGDGRIGGAQQKRVEQPDALEGLPDEALGERFLELTGYGEEANLKERLQEIRRARRSPR